MAKTETRKKADPLTATVPDPRAAMDRMMDLGRRLFAVPKSEIPTKRKRAKRKRGH